MKLTAKFTITITAFGVGFLLFFSLLFYSQTSERLRKEAVHHVEAHMKVLSVQIQQLLMDEITATKIMANNPFIEEALEESNRKFSRYEREQRNTIIFELNEQWMSAEADDPFVLGYLNNSISTFLKRQQLALPGEYGEIFLTDRCGALVASTSKLTTFYHGQKYWWRGAYAEGKGSVFIDDRGFDMSVGGYVLGIVVPIYQKGSIIGFLKCNIDIIHFLESLFLYRDALGDGWNLQIARSNGQVILAEDTRPLSMTVPQAVLSVILEEPFSGEGHYFESDETLYIVSHIAATFKSASFLFGGSAASIDHVQGNEEGHWVVIASAEKNKVYKESRNLLLVMANIGMFFILGMIVIAFFISRGLTRKVRGLIPAIQKVGAGSLDTRLPEESGEDEIGMVSRAFNGMIFELQQTLISKDKLEELIQEKDFLMKELNHRVKNNLMMINSLIYLKNAALGDGVDLSDLSRQIDAIRIVHEKLYKTNRIIDIDFKGYIQDLLKTVFTFSKIPVLIENKIDDISINTRTAIPLGLMVNEIATNAVKHGFSGTEAVFSVTMKEDIDYGQYIFEISNNGKPFPEDIDFANPDTLGMQLISALVEQIKGTLELQRRPRPVFTICFPFDDA